MIPIKKKAVYSKQVTNVFALLFAIIAILGFISIFTPDHSENNATITENLKPQNTYSSYLLKVAVVTITMIVMLVLGLRVYKKQIRLKAKNSLVVDILGRHYISDKQYLLKVDVEDKYLLLGVSDTSINCLAELDKPKELDDEDGSSFGTVLDLETKKTVQV